VPVFEPVLPVLPDVDVPVEDESVVEPAGSVLLLPLSVPCEKVPRFSCWSRISSSIWFVKTRRAAPPSATELPLAPPEEPPPEPIRGEATCVVGTSPAEVDLPPCAVLPPDADVVVELVLDPPEVEVLELLVLVLLFVDVVCDPVWVLTPPVALFVVLRRLSAAAASPSDWLYAVNGASRQTTANAQVGIRVRMEGAPP
jgi:hypothetical protein